MGFNMGDESARWTFQYIEFRISRMNRILTEKQENQMSMAPTTGSICTIALPLCWMTASAGRRMRTNCP